MLVLLLEDDMQTNRLHYYARAAMNEDTPEIRAKNRLPWRSLDDATVCQVSLWWNLSLCKTALPALHITEKTLPEKISTWVTINKW